MLDKGIGSWSYISWVWILTLTLASCVSRHTAIILSTFDPIYLIESSQQLYEVGIIISSMQRWTNRGRSPSSTPGCEPKQSKFRARASWQMPAKTHVNKRAIILTDDSDMMQTAGHACYTGSCLLHGSCHPSSRDVLQQVPCAPWGPYLHTFVMAPVPSSVTLLLTPQSELPESARLWELAKLRETSHFHP